MAISQPRNRYSTIWHIALKIKLRVSPSLFELEETGQNE